MNPKSQALTRMVHDAALRTGHAVHQANAISAFNAPGGFNGSDKGSVAFSPEDASSPQMRPPRQGSISTPNGQGYAPLAHGSANGSESGRRKKAFSIPPLPPQPAIERLVAAYVDFVGVTAPIIHIPTLGKQLQKIRDGRDVEESDVFVVMMVLGELRKERKLMTALSTMASARFVELPDELRACSEAFHAEAMKHLDPVFEEQSYGECDWRNWLICSQPTGDPTSRVVLVTQSGKRIHLVPRRSRHSNLRRHGLSQRAQCPSRPA